MAEKKPQQSSIISVLITRVRHTSDGFSVYTASLDKDTILPAKQAWHELVVKQFTGPVAVGQRWTLAGKTEHDEKLDKMGKPFGDQFVASFATLGVPRTWREAESMCSSGLLPGWDLRAYLAVEDMLGREGALAALTTERNKLVGIPGINDAMIDDLSYTLSRGDTMAGIYAQLAEWEVKHSLADKLVGWCGLNAIDYLTADPYADILNIDGYGWSSADDIGHRLGIGMEDPRRLRAGLAVAVHDQTWATGNTWLSEFDAIRAAAKLTGCSYTACEEEIDAAVLAGHLVVDGGRLYPLSLHHAEQQIADQVSARQYSTDPIPLSIASGMGVDHSISDDQWSAVTMGLGSGLSLLTGGPGVGKTTTLKTLVDQANRMGLSITLMAPTGKAASRMAEATGWPASTIHSRLGLVPGMDSSAWDGDPVTGLVVVDEVSMLDTQLAAALLTRVDPSARILLVGDPDQLPSVGPGAVLRDLLQADVLPRVHLDKVYRNDAGVAINAARIRAGDPILALPDVQLINAESATHCLGRVHLLVDSLLLDGYSRKDLLVLCPTNDGPSGRYTLNQTMQARVNAGQAGQGISQYVARGNKPQDPAERRSEEIRTGDPVIVTKNSKQLGVFNGQLGEVTGIVAKRSITAVIDGRAVTFTGEEKRILTLAYAITGHKSQGSEAKIVISAIMPSRVLSREWVYTVLTRARERAYLIGDVGAIQGCLHIQRAGERQTGLVSGIHARLAAYEQVEVDHAQSTAVVA